MNIGILALQGSFKEHAYILKQLDADPVLVRLSDQLNELDGLIIPGGESTTIGKLMERYDFFDRLKDLVLKGFPIYGTCAGMILLANEVDGAEQPLIGVMDIKVKRNAFGRQVESFEEYFSIPVLGEKSFRGIFIRAPGVEKIGRDVRVLAELKSGELIALEQGNLLVSAFHPELTEDLRMHYYFLQKVLRYNHLRIG